MFGVATAAEPAVEHEHGLDACLDKGEDFGEEASWGVMGCGEIAADYGKHAVDEHASLGDDEEGVVQAYSGLTIT